MQHNTSQDHLLVKESLKFSGRASPDNRYQNRNFICPREVWHNWQPPFTPMSLPENEHNYLLLHPTHGTSWASKLKISRFVTIIAIATSSLDKAWNFWTNRSSSFCLIPEPWSHPMQESLNWITIYNGNQNHNSWKKNELTWTSVMNWAMLGWFIGWRIFLQSFWYSRSVENIK